jgi:hypothetical protein
MIANNMLKLQQYQDGFPLPGFWKLAPERAVTLNPTEAGVLRIAQGQVWATLNGPHHGPANDWGDVVLHGGEQLKLMPGQHVVIEPFGDAVNEPVYFSWEPSSAMAQPAVPGDGSGWSDKEPGQPGMHDDEISIFVRASRRLLSRVGRFLMHFVAGQGRVLSPLETNQP